MKTTLIVLAFGILMITAFGNERKAQDIVTFTCNGATFTHSLTVLPAQVQPGDSITVQSIVTCISTTTGGPVAISLYHRPENADDSLNEMFDPHHANLSPGDVWHPSSIFHIGCAVTLGTYGMASNVRPFDALGGGCEQPYRSVDYVVAGTTICR